MARENWEHQPVLFRVNPKHQHHQERYSLCYGLSKSMDFKFYDISCAFLLAIFGVKG